jgi:hypothetical protein
LEDTRERVSDAKGLLEAVVEEQRRRIAELWRENEALREAVVASSVAQERASRVIGGRPSFDEDATSEALARMAGLKGGMGGAGQGQTIGEIGADLLEQVGETRFKEMIGEMIEKALSSSCAGGCCGKE